MEDKATRYAGTVTVGEKGQFVIPKQVRDMFGIRPGDTLLLLADTQRGIALPPKETLKEYMDRIFAEEG